MDFFFLSPVFINILAKVSSLKLNIFINFLQEFRNIGINELLFPISILYACCAD